MIDQFMVVLVEFRSINSNDPRFMSKSLVNRRGEFLGNRYFDELDTRIEEI